MASDAVALLDHLGLPQAHVMGYSMGARISAFMAVEYPHRVLSLVLGGLGIALVTGAGDWDPIAEALLAPSLEDVTHVKGRMFRAFADQTRSDRAGACGVHCHITGVDACRDGRKHWCAGAGGSGDNR